MQPLVFTPYLRPQVWGGRALATHFGKALPDDRPYGESWEVSGHPHHVSVVAEGPLRGARLDELTRDRRAELLGAAAAPRGRFPLLVKLLDCQALLSVQVHPDDAAAARLLGDELGKTEAWVTLHAGPHARIHAGLKPGATRAELADRCAAGTVADVLHGFTPKAGDAVFLPAGLVHAVGGGVLLAEVQQASDATFRLFDWNRVDPATGAPRELHVANALEAIRFDLPPGQPVAPEALPTPAGTRRERLAACPHFALERVACLGGDFPCDAGRCEIWLVLDGAAALCGPGYERLFEAGGAVVIPAAAGACVWRPDPAATLLRAVPA